jgi:hypothetical protein
MSKHSKKSKRGFKTKGASGKPKYMRKPTTKPPVQQKIPKITAWQIFWWTLKFKVYNLVNKLRKIK